MQGLGPAIPYVLFAYREVPQSSTGFSPFELLYGRAPRGPLDVLKETWEGKEKSSESVVSHILTMRDRMHGGDEGARGGEHGKGTNKWYDQNARYRELKVGCKMLVLLPSSTNKLLAQWQGPYEVLEQVGSVDYMIDMHDRRKRRKIFHVNMHATGVLPTKRHNRGRILVRGRSLPRRAQGRRRRRGSRMVGG